MSVRKAHRVHPDARSSAGALTSALLVSSVRALLCLWGLAVCPSLGAAMPALWDAPPEKAEYTAKVGQFPLATLPDPVGAWDLDVDCASNNVPDTSGNDAHGTKYNGTGCESGRIGTAASFDGIDDRIEIPDQPWFHFTDAMTVTAWVYPTTTNSQAIVNKWYAMNAFNLGIHDGQFAFTVAFPVGPWGEPHAVFAAAAANTWTHVAGVFDGEYTYLYLNGGLAAYARAEGTIQDSSRPVVIGNHPPGSSFGGRIDQIRLYDQALTQSQVRRLAHRLPPAVAWWSFDEKCTTSSVMDTSGHGATGTKLYGVGCVEGRVGRAASFDGGDDLVEIPDQPTFHFTAQMTVAAWIRPSSLDDSAIVNKWYAMDAFNLGLSGGNFNFTVTFPGGVWGEPHAVSTPAAGALDTWTHLAGVFTGSEVRIYVNGVLKASSAATGTLQDSVRPIAIGNHPSGAGFEGPIDEVRLYDVALDTDQIRLLADGPFHRRIRAIAIDPTLRGGYRLHTAYADWRPPSEVLEYWVSFLNDSAGEDLYLPEDGSFADAIRYTNRVPWNDNSMNCTLGQGSQLLLQTAEQFVAMFPPGQSWPPPPRDHVDIFHVFDSFDIAADANGQKFHELIIITPPDCGFGKEGVMVAHPDDCDAYMAHDAVIRMAGLDLDKKFIFHGVSFTRDDRNLEQYWHRVEAIMAHVFSEVTGGEPPCAYPCGAPGSWTHPDGDIQNVRHAWDLFTVLDQDAIGEAQVGNAHFLPNTTVDYVRWHDDRVPGNGLLWYTFPADYPLDLTRNDRRSTAETAEAWMAPLAFNDPENGRRAMIFQLSHLPKGDGTTDGRNNDWWRYVSNPNHQTGRGDPVTPPIEGPFHGARDLRLTILEDRLRLNWIPEVSGAGSYRVEQKSGALWVPLATLPGPTTSYDVVPKPAAGVDTYYRVAWIAGKMTRYSDQLGVRLGTASGSRPPLGASISLYQQATPYVRWMLPTECDAPIVPCIAQNLGCGTDNVCRSGGGAGVPSSDYHQGQTIYFLRRDGSDVWTVHRAPGWEGQYNHLEFSAAEGPVSETVAYQVFAYPLSNGSPDYANPYGNTDVLLAVPGQSTVGW